MVSTRNPGRAARGERRSAAWGKRLAMAMVLTTGMAFAQGRESSNAPEARGFSRMAPELSGFLSRAKQGQGKGQTVKVIVQYRQVPTSAHYATMQGRGGRLQSKLHMIQGAAFEIPLSALPALEADPEIASVTIDHPMSVMDDLTNGATGVSSAWNSGYTGTGVGVAVIDSGINDTHPDLRNANGTSRVVYHQDFTGTPTTNILGGKYDLYGHGTHVAGIIGGNGSLSGGHYAGVAPGVNLIDLRALDANGAGNDSTVIAAIQQAIALKNTYNIKVINLSLGRGIPISYTQDPLCQAVESAWKSGIVVVVAAGNYGRLSVYGSNGYGTVTAPGNDPYVLTVGATKSSGSSYPSAETVASYSSKGPTTYDHVVKPDMIAPGNDIVSLSAPGATLEAAYSSDLVSGSDGNNDYFTSERHEHGNPCRSRRCRDPAARAQHTDSGPSQGASDEDGLQDEPVFNLCLCAAPVPDVHAVLRSVLGWIGTLERTGRHREFRPGAGHGWLGACRRVVVFNNGTVSLVYGNSSVSTIRSYGGPRWFGEPPLSGVVPWLTERRWSGVARCPGTTTHSTHSAWFGVRAPVQPRDQRRVGLVRRQRERCILRCR